MRADSPFVRIEVVDPSGQGLGLACGLVELGHAVCYVPATGTAPGIGQLDRMRDELLAHMFGGPVAFEGGADLLVLVDVFADYLCGLEGRGGAVLDPMSGDPLRGDVGVGVYPGRLAWYRERAQAADRVAVVDMSDRRGPHERAFDALPQVARFAREVGGDGEAGWQPFPFLYNQAMLWLEYMRPESEWRIDGERPRRWDWVFCGTLDHERYGGARRREVERIAARWPELRGAVIQQRPFLDVLGALQSARFGLDLPGAGELCFRLHECLALGVPVWRPLDGRVAPPAGIADLVFDDPLQPPDVTSAEVREAYVRNYAPMAAASWLLDGIRHELRVRTIAATSPIA